MKHLRAGRSSWRDGSAWDARTHRALCGHPDLAAHRIWPAAGETGAIIIDDVRASTVIDDSKTLKPPYGPQANPPKVTKVVSIQEARKKRDRTRNSTARPASPRRPTGGRHAAKHSTIRRLTANRPPTSSQASSRRSSLVHPIALKFGQRPRFQRRPRKSPSSPSVPAAKSAAQLRSGGS